VRFVGIDLAWSPRNPSGGAILSADGKLLGSASDLGSDAQVLAFVANAIPPGVAGLVAIDAPLTVPNETGRRRCDREVAAMFGRFQAGPYPANRRNLARYGGLRAEAIRKQLQQLGFRHDPYIPCQRPVRQAIEVFPHPATISLFGLETTLKYKARQGRDYVQRWQALARLRDHLAALHDGDPPLHLPPQLAGMAIEGLRGRAFKGAEDLLDAIVCAYSALYAWQHGPRGYAVYGPGSPYDDPTQAHILVPMTPTMWQRLKTPRLLLLDRDGTLNRAIDDRPPNRPDEVELLPGIAATLHRHAALGWRLVIVTNQGGIAFGYQTEPQAHAIQRAVLEALPVQIDASYLCPHHPEGKIAHYAIDCPNRKPAPGAILQALARFDAPAGQCLFVGDQESDEQAARTAGVPFQWVQDFLRCPLSIEIDLPAPPEPAGACRHY
jgi:histidinol-phosphate phosphatase family protein